MNNYFNKLNMADWSNKEFVLAAVVHSGYNLTCANDNLKNNKEVVLAAVDRTGDALYYASDDLKKDKEIVLAAVNQFRWALKYAHADLRNDEYFLHEVNKLQKIGTNSVIFKYISERIQNELRENPDYLLEFEFPPVYLKPAKN
jgi:MoxR-like ATPase